MFDRGILSVGENGEILTVKKLIPDQVQRILNEDGRIILPSSSAFAPHSAFTRYHRENIFKGN
jgi:putative restriction endonuclease